MWDGSGDNLGDARDGDADHGVAVCARARPERTKGFLPLQVLN